MPLKHSEFELRCLDFDTMVAICLHFTWLGVRIKARTDFTTNLFYNCIQNQEKSGYQIPIQFFEQGKITRSHTLEI